MGKSTIRVMMALAAFLVLCQWSRPARADVTITGTVGEIGLVKGSNGACGNLVGIIRFKFTDPNQTATCLDQNGSGAKYAYYWLNQGQCSVGVVDNILYKEVYAALLFSKKGATLTCTVVDNTNCHVTSCTLP